jgi:D-glycero-D-manno-heptose 1,7-bisphosphate phosphatase
MHRAVFLDRDGVLNRTDVREGKPYAPKTFREFNILSGTCTALSFLKKIGFLLVVITNQPDVGNGRVRKKIVEKMNVHLKTKLPIDLIKVCYHAQTDNCDCRKPKPKMILEAAQELGIILTQSYMIGDRASDISAGKMAGCTTFLIDHNYAEVLSDEPNFRVPSLEAAVKIITSFNLDK